MFGARLGGILEQSVGSAARMRALHTYWDYVHINCSSEIEVLGREFVKANTLSSRRGHLDASSFGLTNHYR